MFRNSSFYSKMLNSKRKTILKFLNNQICESKSNLRKKSNLLHQMFLYRWNYMFRYNNMFRNMFCNNIFYIYLNFLHRTFRNFSNFFIYDLLQKISFIFKQKNITFNRKRQVLQIIFRIDYAFFEIFETMHENLWRKFDLYNRFFAIIIINHIFYI